MDTLFNFRVLYRSNSNKLLLEATGMVEASDDKAALETVWHDYDDKGYRIWLCTVYELSDDQKAKILAELNSGSVHE